MHLLSMKRSTNNIVFSLYVFYTIILRIYNVKVMRKKKNFRLQQHVISIMAQLIRMYVHKKIH